MMKDIIRRLLREAIDKQSYKDWIDKVSGGSRYKRWVITHADLANKYWSIYSHLYDRYLRDVRSDNELERVGQAVFGELDDKESREAFKMFILYKEDILDGVLEEGFRF